MKRRKRSCVLGALFVAAVCVAAGCAASPAGHNSADVESETYEESAAVKLPETDGEAEEPSTAGLQEPETDGEAEKIFYWGAEEYFHLLEGEWVAMEYAGSISDYHFDEAREEWYQEKEQEHTNEIIEKYLGSEYRIEINNLVYFAPYTDLDLIMEDNEELFSVTRFIPGEFVTITPPYIGLSVQLVDNNERYWFIIDADGTVLIEIKYRFFRLERQ